MCFLKCVNQVVCFVCDIFLSVTKSLPLQVLLNHVHFSHLRVSIALHITTQSGSSVLRLKWPHSPNKDASLLKAPHSTMNLVTTPIPSPPTAICPASSHGLSLEVIRPQALSRATSCLHRPQRHSWLPTTPAFFCQPNGYQIKSTVLQLEFGRIYLVQCSKSHCLTSFSHVAPFLESVTEKKRLVISCNRILLGFFVFFSSVFPF